MEFRALTHPPTSHHHRGERLIRNFGARVPRGNVLFGFPRATISFPPMQACQRRTIGGGGGNGDRGWLAQLRLHPPPLVSSPSSSSPCRTIRPSNPSSSDGTHPILCMPWLHGLGAILGCVWIGTRGCATHSLPPRSSISPPPPSPFLSIYLSICFSTPSRIYRSIVRTRTSRLFLPFPFHRFYLLIAHQPPPPILPSHYGERWEARALWMRVTRETPRRNYRYRICEWTRIREHPERASGSIRRRSTRSREGDNPMIV